MFPLGSGQPWLEFFPVSWEEGTSSQVFTGSGNSHRSDTEEEGKS